MEKRARQIDLVDITDEDTINLSAESILSDSSNNSKNELSQLIDTAMDHKITAKLATSGPVGLAAAAAVVSSGIKRKKPFTFEMNPSIRKRQRNRLLRKLEGIVNEYAVRVGQQAVVLIANPNDPKQQYMVYGAKPLEQVVKNLGGVIVESLNKKLENFAPPPERDTSLFELPELTVDGIPTTVEKMTQAQLRAFIPLMLKYSTGRGKPGWGKPVFRPPWWPSSIPWSNVRMDVRSDEEKCKVSWTSALRRIITNCYKYHGREDLLYSYEIEEPPKFESTRNINIKDQQVTFYVNTGNKIGDIDCLGEGNFVYLDESSCVDEKIDDSNIFNNTENAHILVPYVPVFQNCKLNNSDNQIFLIQQANANQV